MQDNDHHLSFSTTSLHGITRDGGGAGSKEGEWAEISNGMLLRGKGWGADQLPFQAPDQLKSGSTGLRLSCPTT